MHVRRLHRCIDATVVIDERIVVIVVVVVVVVAVVVIVADRTVAHGTRRVKMFEPTIELTILRTPLAIPARNTADATNLKRIHFS